MTVPSFLTGAPRFLFLTGKGGVGKTSVACAAAIALARTGRSVLLVSTDPASNVGQVFGVRIGNTITPFPAVPGLSALEIDPDEAANAYRERIVGPVRNVLPATEVGLIEEQLSGACTTEIASFNEFTGLLTDQDTLAGFDHVVFDTAPTGHTIRLLQLPGSWTDFLNEGKGDASCLGPLGRVSQRCAWRHAILGVMSRMQVLSDSEWELIEPFMPCSDGKRGRRFRDHRVVVEGIIYRYRTGIAWRDLPGEFGPWQTVWKRHRRFAGDGTWDRVLTALLTRADAAGVIDWDVAVDSTIGRAHQHATNTTRLAGGSVESQESARRAG